MSLTVDSRTSRVDLNCRNAVSSILDNRILQGLELIRVVHVLAEVVSFLQGLGPQDLEQGVTSRSLEEDVHLDYNLNNYVEVINYNAVH